MCNDAKESETETNHTQVLIVGAGMAGLSAAYYLTRNGCTSFKILEARNRVGGRIVQVPMGTETVELGANWIHGILGNPVYEFAMEHSLVDILQVPKQHRVVAALETGKQVPFEMLHEIYEAYLCFLRRCEEYFVTNYVPPGGIESVGDHIKLEVNLYLDQFNDVQQRHLRQLIFDCLLKRETCISGCDNMSEIDVLEIGSYTELQGGNITLPKGYSSILEPISKQLPKNSIKTGCPVALINWCTKANSENDDESDDSDRTVIDEPTSRETSEERCFNIEVVTETGEKFYSDHLICTVPLGVLKQKAMTLFQPQLPDYKLEAIDRLLFGTVDKILLEYDRPFLNPNVSEVLLLWDYQMDTEKNDYSKTWFKKIYSFSKVTDTLLLAWISGKEAEYMETLSNELVVDTCTGILRKFLNDPFIPKPKNCICTSWHTQPYTRGSYTAIAIGASQIDIECIAQPLYSKENQDKPVLLFAGEHTHANFYSTVHGAFLTGRTAAQIVLTPDAPEEIVVDCEDTNDLSSWIQGIKLE